MVGEKENLMAKLLIYPVELKVPTKTRKALEADGYILLAEDQLGSVRVLEPLPEIDVTTDSAWLLRVMSQIILADSSYHGSKSKLADAMLGRVKERVGK